jgi:hypothetical protein
MIAQFPTFESISISSKEEINNVVDKFKPYSDFNFVSMFSWDVQQSMLVSELNKNLVVRFKDYTSDNSFLSFIGDNNIDETIKALIKYSGEHGMKPQLHLIPEAVVEKIQNPTDFIVKEDRDSHDYIVLSLKLSELKGKNYAAKRNGRNKFVAIHGERTKLKHLQIDDLVTKDILNTFHNWRQVSEKQLEEAESELLATQRLLVHSDHFELMNLGIYIDEVMVAYSIYEIRGDFAIGHFEKAIKTYPGLYDFLKHYTADELHKKGVKYINYEQDLGIEGIRNAKLLLHPETFLKKFTIKLTE